MGTKREVRKHVAAYHHSGVAVVTQHATERATERERERVELGHFFFFSLSFYLATVPTGGTNSRFRYSMYSY